MMTAAEFAERRPDLPDSGRWTELVAGETRVLHPPDPKHGNVVLNLSKSVAAALTPASPSYAAFDLGVPTRRDPDTVRFPAMSVYTTGSRFAAVDLVVAEERPVLVVEVASTNDRRRTVAERVYEYHGLGVDTVWVADTHGEAVTVLPRDGNPVTVSGTERLRDVFLLPGFEVVVADLFADPAWWHGRR